MKRVFQFLKVYILKFDGGGEVPLPPPGGGGGCRGVPILPSSGMKPYWKLVPVLGS